MFGNNFSLSLTMQSSRCTRAPGKPASIKMVSLTHSVSSSSLGFSRRVVAVDMVWQIKEWEGDMLISYTLFVDI